MRGGGKSGWERRREMDRKGGKGGRILKRKRIDRTERRVKGREGKGRRMGGREGEGQEGKEGRKNTKKEGNK